ncbi:acyl-ACP thioesterase [Roseiarcus fermentans]|uniref:Acyl-ACP thioesterase n=1 Tax=Roseiarcus fermentans TaxID=1473586 RepID=A0A366EP02_9HYPH|nr:acyl-ACP thioesterase domain-containing protein [Roseiarcus fermentans]RBP04147.1 acyl-ACP thioesterase [Roseiarcus fermentans]
MTSAIWTERYAVNTLVVNGQKRLGLVGLLKILQDVAWIHGDHLGHGFDAMMARGWIWVLARQKLVMGDWPTWGDVLSVRTWVRPIEGVLVMRDTEIWSAGRKVGESVASWLVLDAATRRPPKTGMRKQGILARDDGALDLAPARIAPSDDLAPLARFRVHTSDLDANGHVNNVRYAQWILDAAPASAHRTRVVRDYEVNFLAETSVGDAVSVEWDGGGAAATDALRFQGRREADGRVVFAARLQVVPATAA